MREITSFAATIHLMLEEVYGKPSRNPPPLNNKADPIDELVYILLTLLTHEKNAQRAFDNLIAMFPTWRSVMEADTPKVVEALEIAGLANQKATRLKEILSLIERFDPNISLDFLRSLPDKDVEIFLTGLKGVGKKAARCVMMYALDREVLPVDTHVYRVSRRLGLIPANVAYDKAMDEIHLYTAPELRYDLHVNLIRHGRQICTAPIPKCHLCPLNKICNSYQDSVFVPPPPPPGTSRPRH